MAKGRAIVEKSRRGISRWKGDEDEEEDEEYIAEEEEELESESYDESLASSSDSEEDGGEFGGNLEEFSGSDGSVEEDSDFEVDESEFDEEEEIRVKSSTKGRNNSRKTLTKARRKVLDSEEDDEDFDFKPVSSQNRRKQSRKTESDGSDYEEEEDEDSDEDFTPDVEDDEEESVSISKRKNGYKERARKSHAKRARKNKTSKVSRRRKPTVTKNKKEKNSRKKRGSRRKRSSPKEPAPKRRRRSAQMEDDDFIVDDDDDYILEDRVEPDKKSNKRKPVSDSDTSEFEFITSDEDSDRAIYITEEQIGPKKRKKNNTFCSESGSGSDSSDCDFVVYDEEVVKEVRKRKREDVKGKEKQGDKEDDSGKKMCGICLSEEQRRTTRGVLDCCAHFFCFACIVEWSKVESRCPVCKRRFETITKASSSDSDSLGFGAPRKVIKVPKRDQVYQPSEEDIRGMLDPYENVVCMECQQGGDDNLMLLCDICDSSAHTYCVGLGNAVPEGNWYCDCCRSAGVGPSNLQPQPSGGSNDPAPTEFDPLVNLQPTASSSSALEIDLNAPPRDILEEASTQVPGGPSQVPSPSTGGAATLSGRRAIQNRIRILLSHTRPLQAVRRNIEQENGVSNGVRSGLRVGRSIGQQGSTLAPHGERSGPHDADNVKEQVRSMVKNHVKQLCSNTLDRDAYKDVVKRATYTVLAACGFRLERRNLVSNSIPAPTDCPHEIHDSGQASLLVGSCSTCFDSFVRNAVSCILSRD